MADELLADEQRQEIFRTLVELQDAGRETEQSRKWVAAQFSVAVNVVQAIEREGITKQWPPL